MKLQIIVAALIGLSVTDARKCAAPRYQQPVAAAEPAVVPEKTYTRPVTHNYSRPVAQVQPAAVLKPVAVAPTTSYQTPAGLTADQAAGLAKHNSYRSHKGVAPLAWSESLERTAQIVAQNLAAQGCRLQHSKGNYGENLAAVWGADQPFSSAVDTWMREPEFGTNHRSQVMWRGSKQVGCASARGYGCRVNVCNYLPAGNVVGQRAY